MNIIIIVLKRSVHAFAGFRAGVACIALAFHFVVIESFDQRPHPLFWGSDVNWLQPGLDIVVHSETPIAVGLFYIEIDVRFGTPCSLLQNRTLFYL